METLVTKSTQSVEERRRVATSAAIVRLARNTITENLTPRGRMEKVRRASEHLAQIAPTPMRLRLTLGKRMLAEIPVATVNEASALWSLYRDSRVLSGGQATARAEILVDGIARGYVSYNGRVWEGTPQDWKPGQTPLFDPSGEIAPAGVSERDIRSTMYGGSKV